jgi:SnoaL-like domain
MSAREEILHLMNSYGFTIDTGDFEGCASLFSHGAWEMEGAKPHSGKQEMLALLANVKLYEDGTPKTKHVTSNVDLTINEAAGTARSECYVTVFQQTADLPLQAIFSGHYFDTFERENGSWRFVKRLIRHMLVGDMRAHLKVPSETVPKA